MMTPGSVSTKMSCGMGPGSVTMIPTDFQTIRCCTLPCPQYIILVAIEGQQEDKLKFLL
jgi:hypothetical protein